MNYENLFAEHIEKQLLKSNKQKIRQNLKKESVQQNIKKLYDINQQLQHLIEKKKANNKSFKWSEVLDGAYYIINFNKVQEKDDIKKIIFEAYEITSLILQDLELIRKIENVVSFIDDDYNYIRLENFKFNAEYMYLNPTASRRGKNYGLRLQSSKFQQQILEAKQQQNYEIINNHFHRFIKPFIDYEESNKTGWKINKGVLAETFQRHWQKNHSNYIQGSLPDDFESIGERWWMYRESSGSDPYFTGPDTDIAQVKNINASLISNVNTVINTIKGILLLIGEKNFQQISEENIEKIFKQKDIKPSISKKIYEGMNEKGKREIERVMKEIFGEDAHLSLTK